MLCYKSYRYVCEFCEFSAPSIGKMNEEIKEAVLNTEEECVPRKRQRGNTGSQTDEDCVRPLLRCLGKYNQIRGQDRQTIRLVYRNRIASVKDRLTERVNRLPTRRNPRRSTNTRPVE